MASSASLNKAEVFVHPVYGRAVRATERIPAGTVVLKERPLIALIPSAEASATAAKAVTALQCQPSVPERMLVFCAAPEAVRERILQLFDGGGPTQWPKHVPDSDTFPDKLMYASDSTATIAAAVAAWLTQHAAAARGFSVDTLARAAVIVSLNAHGLPHGSDDEKAVSTLFDISSKFAHSCSPNAYYNWCTSEGVLTHRTLREVAPGEVITIDYHTGGSAESTAVRRHRLMRAKFFHCRCALCVAPDALAALPCPVCVRREGDGTLPLDRVFAAPDDAADWEHPCFLSMLELPIAIPDDGAVGADDAGAPPAAAGAAWRCAKCGGVFSRDRMARTTIAEGVRRPLPRSDMLSARFGPAPLLDVARWAECNSVSGVVQLHKEAELSGQDADIFAPGGLAETQARNISVCINEMASLVGPSHASVTQLRLYRLRMALQGTFKHVNALPQSCPPGAVAPVLRRLLGVRAGSVAAAIPASTLLAAEVASLATTLRRAKRLAALTPQVLCHLTCVMAALNGFEDQHNARMVFDLLRDAARKTSEGADTETELTHMQTLVLSHAPLWKRGGGGSSAA